MSQQKKPSWEAVKDPPMKIWSKWKRRNKKASRFDILHLFSLYFIAYDE